MNNGGDNNKPENNQKLSENSSSTYSKLCRSTSSSSGACSSAAIVQPPIVSLPIPTPDNDESPADDLPNQQQVIVVNYPIPARPLRQNRRSLDPEKAPSYLPLTVDTSPPKLESLAVSEKRDKSASSTSETIKATVRERNACMLFNESMSDIWFLVGSPAVGGQQRIPAHSYVLATGSSVFYAMFYGNFAKSPDIPVPDVDPAAFRILLKYLYTDEIDLDSENVLSTLYAAKKYLVAHLTKACINYLETSLNAHNVCLLLSQSRLFEEEDLMTRCWDVIDAQAELALMSDGFLDLDIDTLESILSRETLTVRETVVFDAALRWADAECRRQHLETTPGNRRSVLRDVFRQIRFPTMKVEEFANGPAQQAGMLDAHEIADVFLYHFARHKPELLFVARPRLKLPLQRCHRFQSSAYRSNQWRYRGRCDSIQFCADRRIFVVGFGLYGSSNGSADYKALIELKRSGHVLASVSQRFFSDGSSNVFSVYFDQPVQVEPDVFYTASAVLDGGELSYFGQDGVPEVQSGKVMFQFQCSTESTNGTGVQGGQIPEILFYG